jgi:hypothetical protein
MDNEIAWRLLNLATTILITMLMYTLRQLASDVRSLTHLVGDLRDRVARLEGRAYAE